MSRADFTAPRLMARFKVTVLVALLLGLAVGAPAGQKQEQRVVDDTRLLRGELWIRLDDNAKLAYLWGAANVVEVERQLMAEIPQLRVQNFSAKVAEANHGMTFNALKDVVDRYYREHPDRLRDSVLRVLWDETVVPRIETSIAGEPLRR